MKGIVGIDQTILVVDDDPEQIHLISSILECENYRIQGITDSDDIFESIDKETPDLILLDILMPKINGIELCYFMMNNSKYSSIPIIMLTSIKDKNVLTDSFFAGAKDYVSKPVNPQELIARVNAQLELKYKRAKLEEVDKFAVLLSDNLKYPFFEINKLIKYIVDEFDNIDLNEKKLHLNKTLSKSKESLILIDKLHSLSNLSNSSINVVEIDSNKFLSDIIKNFLDTYSFENVSYTICKLPDIKADEVLLKQAIINILFCIMKDESDSKLKIEISFKENDKETIFCIKSNLNYMDNNTSNILLYKNSKYLIDFSIVKKIISLHNGRIWMEFIENEGQYIFFSIIKNL